VKYRGKFAVEREREIPALPYFLSAEDRKKEGDTDK